MHICAGNPKQTKLHGLLTLNSSHMHLQSNSVGPHWVQVKNAHRKRDEERERETCEKAVHIQAGS
jgi:hypothetical protein